MLTWASELRGSHLTGPTITADSTSRAGAGVEQALAGRLIGWHALDSPLCGLGHILSWLSARVSHLKENLEIL